MTAISTDPHDAKELARVRDLLPNLTQLGERVAILEELPDAAAERSALFGDLCSLYERIDPAMRTAQIDTSVQAAASAPKEPSIRARWNLRGSIDALLDQLAAGRSESRLWTVKAGIVLTQLRELAEKEIARLEAALETDETAVSAPRAISETVFSALLPASRWQTQVAA